MKIVLEPKLVDKRERSWKERLLTWPWHPFKKFDITPSPKMLQYNDTHLVMHPATFKRASELIRKYNENTNHKD